MNIQKLEDNIKCLVHDIARETFIYDLLLAYGLPKASISRLRNGTYNQAKTAGEILWKKKLYFKTGAADDLHGVIDGMQTDSAAAKQQPRFLIVTDFQTFLAIDTKTDDSLDIAFHDLPNYFDFFLPWAGLEKTQVKGESLADIRAAERLGRLYDIICETNPTDTLDQRHALNIFLSRLLFCFFAEDTGIFAGDQFTNGVASHTAADGHDLQPYLHNLFRTLSVPERDGLPNYLKQFPYVNGGLFNEEYPVPSFSRKARQIIIECGALNWKEINPDIFGSMIQAVVHSDQRGSLGMHYTSVTNIMKVIGPLFLNELYEELDKAGNSKKKLQDLLTRLRKIRIFDPACGSGNFLIIAYKELCRLEIEILKRLQSMKKEQMSLRFMSNIRLTQFYGIELDDFAHETAKLSLWLAEHQMNMAFQEVFGESKPTLPLTDGGNIVCGNATRIDWESVCPKDEGHEIYVLGNPPYLGSTMQTKVQKTDLAEVFREIKNYKNIDYIGCWFLLGARYIHHANAQMAFVTTNSISQGEQVAILWPHVFALGLEIGFAHQSFKWANNARGNAGVTCAIIGIRSKSENKKLLFNNNISYVAKNINPYLTTGQNLIIQKCGKPLSTLPKITYGNKPVDGGNLILSFADKEKLVADFPESKSFIRPFLGSSEYIRGVQRFCLWIEDDTLSLAESIQPIKDRIKKVREVRLASKDEGANKMASRPHQFREMKAAKKSLIIIPSVSSERREYIPIGFLDSDTIISNLAFAIYDPPTYIFAIISSRLHMTWVRAVAGRLKTDYRYSSALCYNTFPFPDISEKQKTTLEDHVFTVLDERELHPEKTMAQLYDPDKMPDGLRRAHHEMDLAVERCYRAKPFSSDEERLEYLFKLYEEMVQAEGK